MSKERYYLTQRGARTDTIWEIYDAFNGNDSPLIEVNGDAILAEELLVFLNKRHEERRHAHPTKTA